LTSSARFSAFECLLWMTSLAIATSPRCIQLIDASESSNGGSSRRRSADSLESIFVAGLAAVRDLATPTRPFVVGDRRQDGPAQEG